MGAMPAENYVILLIEDSEDDAILFRGSLKRAGYDNPVVVLRSGDEAFRYLKGEPPYSDRASVARVGLAG